MSDAVLVNEIPADAVAVIEREGLNEQAGKLLLVKFAPYNEQINAALATSKTITDGESVASQKVARACRLEFRRIRCEIENARKDSKADALRYGKAVDGLANVLKFLCEPEEKRLEDIEKHAERVEAARVAALVADRSAKLVDVEADPAAYNLAAMDDATFDATLEMASKIRDDRIEAERKAEAARIAKEQAEAEERKRMIEENERLKVEADAREKQAAKLRDEVEKDRKRIEAERAKERAELEAKAKSEADAREKLERDAAEVKRKAQEAKTKAEQERAAQDKKEADEKYRKTKMNGAYQSLVKMHVDTDIAKAVIKAIADGKVDNVRMVW